MLVASLPIIDEIVRTLSEQYFLDRSAPDDRDEVMEALFRDADHVMPTSRIEGAATHPEDDLILATAIDGQAELLVTGDRQLLRTAIYQGVGIIGARDFLAVLDTWEE